jgi:hypothetical protein
MNSTVSTIIKIVLLVAIVGLAYYLYEIIMEPIRYENIKEKRYELTKSRLEQIRDVQKVYRSEYNEFAKDFNSLIAFVDTGKQSIVERKDSSFKWIDPKFLIETTKDTIIVRVIGQRSVKEALFGNDFDASKLRYIPLSENEQEFEMEAGKIKVNDIVVTVFEARAPNTKIFADVLKKYDQFIDNDYALKVGSMTEPTLNGNWR